jgi:hypothetical protein
LGNFLARSLVHENQQKKLYLGPAYKDLWLIAVPIRFEKSIPRKEQVIHLIGKQLVEERLGPVTNVKNTQNIRVMVRKH